MRIAAFAVVVFRALLVLLAVLYFSIALAIVGVRYVLLPNLDSYRPDIERIASRVLKAPVQIDALGADWYRLHPQLHLSGVRLLDADGQPALQLARVDVLLSWRSLLTFQPELLRLQLRAPVLDARRDAAGHVSVAGFPVASTGGQVRLGEHPAMQWLLRQRSIEIRDATVNWHDEFSQAPPLRLEKVNVVLRYALLSGTRFALQASLPEAMGKSLDIRGEVQRNLLGLSGMAGVAKWRGRVYAAVEDVELAALQPWLHERLPGMRGRAAARVWAAFEDGIIGQWSGDVAALGLELDGMAPLTRMQLGQATIGARGDAARRTLHADIDATAGMLSLPSIFERGEVPVHSLSTALDVAYPDRGVATWRFERTRVDAGEPDARVNFQADATWRAEGRSRAGTIDLEGRVERGEVGAVARFMPRVVGPGVRAWLDDGLIQGAVEGADVRLAGDLADFPFDRNPESGAFRVSGRLRQVALNVTPHMASRWPEFESIDGTLLIDRATLEASVASATIRDGLPDAVVLKSVQVGIPNLHQGAVLTVQGEAAGTAEAFLAYVRKTPLAGITGGALDSASATGNWIVPLKVVVPLTHAGDLLVDGAVRFNSNTLRLSGAAPVFTRLSGAIGFTEKSISANQVQGMFLGGPISADGTAGPQGGEVSIKGTVQAQALQSWQPAEGMKRLSGAAAYAATVGMDEHGTVIRLRSDLGGMAFDLPAPLAKAAAAQWPLEVKLAGTGARNVRRLEVSLDKRADLVLELSSAAQAMRMTRAGLGVSRAAVLPDAGFRADIQTPLLDVDAWNASLAEFLSDAGSRRAKATAVSYDFPVVVNLQADTLHVMDLNLRQASVRASGQGSGKWQATVDSEQAVGTVNWFDPPTRDTGVERISAHFGRLILERPARDGTTPDPVVRQVSELMPDVDLLVDQFSLGDWPLGQLKLVGDNAGQHLWTLRELLLENPDVRISASGTWEKQGAAASGPQRRMMLHTDWRIQDFGGLLERLGMPGVVAGGKGSIKGTLAWTGKPFSYDLPSLEGDLGLALNAGRFLQAPSTAGRLLGIFSLQTLARAATFQRGNLFESGFAWDTIRSEVVIRSGVAQISSFRMNGPSATAVLSGSTDLMARTQDLNAVIVPHIDASAAALLAGLAVNPVIGVGAFIGQWLLRQPLAAAFTYRYTVKGSWSEPIITRTEAE